MSATDTFGFDDELDDVEESTDETPRPPRASTLAVLLPMIALGVAIYLEIALAIDSRILGAVPDLALIVLVAIALRFGPIAGAIAGFVSGLLIDIAIQGPVGASALVLTPIGWASGAWSDRRRRISLAMAVTVLAVATIAAIGGDVLVTLVIEGQGLAWGTFAIQALAELATTVLIGIPTLAVLRRISGERPGVHA